ncbi:MAG TPA: hypothetical protein DEP78_14550 [Verrucomicrobiales bacterium]|nr:hypothetical protein [Verrucomicrobiales bacterium]
MKKHLFLRTLVAVALTLFATVDSQAGVSKAAFLQGSQVEGGGEFLSSSAPISIAFNERSSIDPSAFDHDINNLHQLKVTEAGDYLIVATMPVIAVDTPDNRPCAGLEVYVNGAPAAGSLGQSGYIRNQPRNTNMQSETSCHTHLLIPGLNAGDIIEMKAIRTAQPTTRLQIQTASLYVEQIDGSRSAFSGLSDDALVGVNLNPDFEGAGEDPVELVWASNRKDSGFSHSNGNSEVQLSAGTYLVYVNVPLQRTSSSRLSPSLEILLDGQIVPGGQSRQGYNRNASGHIESSVHFAGVVEVSGNQTLTTQLVRYLNSGNTGNAVLPDGKQASIFVEKIGDSGVFLSSGSETTNDGDPTDWNAASKEQIVWGSASLSDGTYSQSGEAITVKQAGDYLLVYNDLLQSSATRPNPRITVEVNGEAVPGAETKTHYIRNSNGHNSASGTLSILLEGLSANDVVTVSTQREGQTGYVGIEEFSNEAAIVGLIKKNSLDPATLTSAPRVISFGGDREGFYISIQQYSSSVVADSVSVLLNGGAVEASVSTSGSVTSITYSFPSIPDSLSSHVIDLSYTDSAGASQSASLGFTVADIYAKVSPSSANASVDTSSSGFVANVSQISSNVHGNNIDNANRQLAGGYSDADGVPYLNEAGPINATSWEFSPVDIAVVNLEQDGAAAGNFNENTGFADDFIPNIPGINESTDGIAAEFLTYLELSKGFHTLGVNSDDGFDVTIGPDSRDLLASSVGSFNGGRGSSDSLFEVYVEEGGYYPTRLLWFEGTGGANVEFFSVVDGQKILINDRDNPNAIKAYKSAKTRPYISDFGPISGIMADQISFQLSDGDIKVDQNSISLSLDGELLTSFDVDVKGDVIDITYNHGKYFEGGEHLAVLSYTEVSDPLVSRNVENVFISPTGMPSVLLDGPFAYYGLSEADGNILINGVSEANYGTYQNNPFFGEERLVVGAASSSVLFDSSKQHGVIIPNHSNINSLTGNPSWTEKTIEFWFKPRNLPSSQNDFPGYDITQRQVIYEQGGATRGINVYLAGSQNSDTPNEAELWFNVLNRAEATPWGGVLPYNETVGVGTDRESIAISTTVEAGNIYHVALVYQGSSEDGDLSGAITGYINGSKFGTIEGANKLFNHTDGIAIGRRNNEVSFHDLIVNSGGAPEVFDSSDQFYYDGWLDEFALYNVALSQGQVKAHYDAGMTEVPFTPDTGGGDGQINSIALSDGAVVIEFEGVLKSASGVTGPYAPIVGATSPYSVAPHQSAQFYIAE